MKGEECFKQNKSTLKNVSYDDKNKVYMTESTIPVYDFDGIKDWYWDNIIKSREKGSSNDALWVDGERMIFIEFKNGNFQLFAKNGLARKLYESDVRIKIEQVKMRISHSPNRGIIEAGGISPWQTILTSNLSWMQSSTTRNMRSLG